MANWKSQSKALAIFSGVFAALFFMPVNNEQFGNSLMEAVKLVRWYAREHVLLCLLPAFFIAGAIGVFVSQGSVMKYLGPKARKTAAYAVASVSGTILAVCSCTVLPLFAGIYKMGAGLGPATAFLYSGPAINVLAIIMTARILGLELGIARAVGAVVFSVLIGLAMHFIYERGDKNDQRTANAFMPDDSEVRPLWKTAVFFALLTGILVFSNWAPPSTTPATPAATPATTPAANTAVAAADIGLWASIYGLKWVITSILAAILALVLALWMRVAWLKLLGVAVICAAAAILTPSGGLWAALPFTIAIVGLAIALATTEGEPAQWLDSSWTFTKQITPLLLAGVLVAGFLLGSPNGRGLIPPHWVAMLVGDSPAAFFDVTGMGDGPANSVIAAVWPLLTNLFASVLGAFMYFATLTEVPILQGLIAAGMGKGPALALLLAGPALSLPNMLVIAGVLGVRKTVTFVTLVIVMATISGMIFGFFF